ANPPKPLHPVAQLLQLAQGGRCPATSIKPRVAMFHDLAQCPQRRPATGDLQAPWAFGWCPVAFDAQEAPLAQGTDCLLHGGAFVRQAASRLLFGRWSAALQLGLGRGQALAL